MEEHNGETGDWCDGSPSMVDSSVKRKLPSESESE